MVHSGLPLSRLLPLLGHSCQGSLQKRSQTLCLSLLLAVYRSPESCPLSFSQAILPLRPRSERAGIASTEPRAQWQGQQSYVSTEGTPMHRIGFKGCTLSL